MKSQVELRGEEPLQESLATEKAFLEKLRARRAASQAGPSPAVAATEFDEGVKQARRGAGPAGEKEERRQVLITEMKGLDRGLTKQQVEAARHYIILFFYTCRMDFEQSFKK